MKIRSNLPNRYNVNLQGTLDGHDVELGLVAGVVASVVVSECALIPAIVIDHEKMYIIFSHFRPLSTPNNKHRVGCNLYLRHSG